jgi:hypothetical protein
MAKLTDDQKRVLLLLDDANVDPDLVNMDVVRELIELRLIGPGGKDELELTDAGETAIKKLQREASTRA